MLIFVLATDIHGSEDSYKINFEEIENVSSAFSTLFSIFQKVISALNDDEFQIIKNACMAQANESLCSLLHSASNSHCLFRVLAENKLYCNWIRINFLEIIAYAHVNQHLVNLIKNYKKAIFSKPLHKLWSSLPHYSVRDKYYTELKATFDDKDPDNMTVEELMKSKPQLAKEIAMLITMADLPNDNLQKYEEEINCGWLSFMYLHGSYLYVRIINYVYSRTYIYIHMYVHTYTCSCTNLWLGLCLLCFYFYLLFF